MKSETDLLSELIQRKRECLAQLYEVGLKQLELVRDGAMTDLLDLLALKQRMMMHLQQIEYDLTPFRGQSPEQRVWRAPEDRRACMERLKQCEILLAAIVDQERRSEQELTRRRDETAQQLQGMHSAHRARDAYVAPATASSASRLDLTAG